MPIAQEPLDHVRLLRSFGFRATSNPEGFVDLSAESDRNIDFLSRVLDKLGRRGAFDREQRILSPCTNWFTEADFALSMRKCHSGSESGQDRRGELAAFEPYIASLTNFFNQIGLITYACCEGHWKGQSDWRQVKTRNQWPHIEFFGAATAHLAASMLTWADRTLTFRLSGSECPKISFEPQAGHRLWNDLDGNQFREQLAQTWQSILVVATKFWDNESEFRMLADSASFILNDERPEFARGNEPARIGQS